MREILNLDIKPVHYDFLGCFEDSVISAAKWAGYRYELVFTEAWSFPFDLDEYQASQSLGMSLKIPYDDFALKLKEYHGIQVKRHGGISLKEAIELTIAELENHRPAILSIDSFFCPWDWNFTKRHFHHAILVTGIGDKGELFCCDGFFKICETISEEELAKGFLGWFFNFSFDGNERVAANWPEILENAVNRINEGNPFNAFEAIRKFADVLENTNDIQKELKGHEDFLFKAPLIKNLEIIAYGRRKFAKMLNFFGEETGIQTLRELADSLIEVASFWATVRSMLIKMAFLEEISVIKEWVVKKIRDIANLEENIANQLFALSQKNATSFIQLSNRHLPSCNEVERTSIITPLKVLMVDLSPYFNNKAFGESISSDCIANFDGTGAYLLKENIPDTEIWKIDTMEFKTSGFNGNQDNISCNGQIILIGGEQFQSIIIMGTAEWGSFTDKITVHYIDGQTEELNIQFTEWLYQPFYGETIAWEGRGVEKINGVAQVMGPKLHLFAQQYPIKTMTKIDFLQLPYCPGIHIFAITLA